MNLEAFFSRDFLARLHAVAAERGLDEMRVLDDWVINAQLWAPIARWERDANAVGEGQQLGLFTLNVPAEDIRVLMGLAYLASVTGNPPSAVLAPNPPTPFPTKEGGESSPPLLVGEGLGVGSGVRFDRAKMGDTLDLMQTLLKETIDQGTWNEPEFDKSELQETLETFFGTLRKLLAV